MNLNISASSYCDYYSIYAQEAPLRLSSESFRDKIMWVVGAGMKFYSAQGANDDRSIMHGPTYYCHLLTCWRSTTPCTTLGNVSYRQSLW